MTGGALDAGNLGKLQRLDTAVRTTAEQRIIARAALWERARAALPPGCGEYARELIFAQWVHWMETLGLGPWPEAYLRDKERVREEAQERESVRIRNRRLAGGHD